jgi:hypothetical protein
MIQKTTTMLLVCGLLLAGASAVSAQVSDKTDRGFVTVAGGLQLSSRSVEESGTFTLYDEPGSFTGSRPINKGLFFEISGGVHVTGKFSVGAAFSRFAKPSDVEFTAKVPHPLFFDTPRTATLNVTSLGHTETAIHIQAIYMVMERNKLDVSVVGGPSLMTVSDDTVAAIAATETGSPYTALSLAATFGSASKRGVGVNAGVNANYNLTAAVAASVIVRYTYASMDMAGTGGVSHTVKAGGPRIGIGLRYRF